MFDLVTGESRRPLRERTMAPTLVSVVGHAVVVVGLVTFSLFATEPPPVVPTMMAFVAAPPAPPPPPPPPPPASSAKRAHPKVQPQSRPGAFAAPIEAPFDVTPEPEGEEGSEGVEGGIEGGVVGGVVGGIVGGLVEAPPPPPPPVAATVAPRGPVRVGGDIREPALTHRVEPSYSDLAMLAQVEGIVILEATVGADGHVEAVRVLRSVKFLDQSAIVAVKQWRYTPLVLNGVATPFVLTVTVNFTLKRE